MRHCFPVTCQSIACLKGVIAGCAAAHCSLAAVGAGGIGDKVDADAPIDVADAPIAGIGTGDKVPESIKAFLASKVEADERGEYAHEDDPHQ